MYCISGVVKTVVHNPARAARGTGEISDAYDQVQIESARETDGGTKFELTTLVTKYGDDFRSAIGKNVVVPVNVYINGKGKLSTYELEGAKFAVSDIFVSTAPGALGAPKRAATA